MTVENGWKGWLEDRRPASNGDPYKIAGRICMDQFMVNFENDLPELGDEVLIFGSDKINTIRMETIADTIDSTPYVIATDIKGRTLRKYKN